MTNLQSMLTNDNLNKVAPDADNTNTTNSSDSDFKKEQNIIDKVISQDDNNKAYIPTNKEVIDNITRSTVKASKIGGMVVLDETCPKHKNQHLIYFKDDPKSKICPLCTTTDPFCKQNMHRVTEVLYKEQQIKNQHPKNDQAKLIKPERSQIESKSQMANDFYSKTNQAVKNQPIIDAKNALADHSLLDSPTVINDSFDNFKVTNQPQATVKKYSKITADFYIKSKNPLNIMMYGKSGVGKSHLAMSILKAVNSNIGGTKFDGKYISCLFINVNTLMNKIRSTFNDDSKLTEDQILKQIDNAYLIVLDDFGTELNGKYNMAGMNFTNRVIYHILDSRVRTIFTTNLHKSQLNHVYDPRIISRLNSHLHLINFSGISDYRNDHSGSEDRENNLPF